MSRILYVEDEDVWLALVDRALADYQLDSAATYGEAVLRLQQNPEYDLVIVDLNLKDRQDGWGREFLDLLIARYSSVRRIVMTGSVAGSMSGLIERYALEDVILKGEATAPDLLRVVNKALHADASKLSRVAQTQFDLRSALKVSQRTVETRLEEVKKQAERYFEETGRVSKMSADRARETLEAIETVRQNFEATYKKFEDGIMNIAPDDDTTPFLEEMSKTEEELLKELSRQS